MTSLHVYYQCFPIKYQYSETYQVRNCVPLMLLAQYFLISIHKKFKKSLSFEIVYNCLKHKRFTCQNVTFKLLESITVMAVIYRYGCPFHYK